MDADLRSTSTFPPRAWAALACGSLLGAGALALALVAARAPGLDRLVTDPAFFRRCLVVHVDLALACWQLALIGALWCAAPGPRRAAAWDRAGAAAFGAGLAAMLLSAAIPRAEPVLSNYIPAIDHPLFVIGLLLMAAGLASLALDGRLVLPGEHASALRAPQSTGILLRAAVVAVAFALATFAASALTLPAGLAAEPRWELLGWGGGHVLQFATSAAMLACWTLLVARTTGRDPLRPREARLLAGMLVAPLTLAPALAASPGGSKHAFTRLMELGIAPAVLLALLACCLALARARREGVRVATFASAAFASSAALTVFGYWLGARITGQDTVVPAHYHAAIGGVTCAFMAVTPVLLSGVGVPCASARWQPALFAAGQAVFAAGFALAGAHGMARKVYGTEQARSSVQTIGLVTMALGGVVAVAAGLWFLGFTTRAWATLARRSFGGPHGSDAQAAREAHGQPVAAAGARAPDPLPLLHAVGADRAVVGPARAASVRSAR